jgi:hypothetical protein
MGSFDLGLWEYGDMAGLRYPLHWPTNYSWQAREYDLLTDIILSCHTVEASVALA